MRPLGIHTLVFYLTAVSGNGAVRTGGFAGSGRGQLEINVVCRLFGETTPTRPYDFA